MLYLILLAVVAFIFFPVIVMIGGLVVNVMGGMWWMFAAFIVLGAAHRVTHKSGA